MKITFNGKKMEINTGGKLIDIIGKLCLDQNSIVIEHNYKIINKKDWDRIVLNENDNIEILELVGGG